MNKIAISFISTIMLTFSTAMAQTSTVIGKIAKHQTTDTLLVYIEGHEKCQNGYDTIHIDKKGRFTMSYDIKEMTEALVFIKSGNNNEPSAAFCVLLQPNKTLNADIKMKPFRIKYTGDEAEKSTYANMYYKAFSNSNDFTPDSMAARFATFTDTKKFVDSELAKMETVVKTIADKEFAKQAQAAIDDQRDAALVGYGISREKLGKTMLNDNDFMSFIDNIDRNDTLQAMKIYNYLEWYYAAHPALYTPMQADGAKIKYLAEYTQNQDVRNKVANIYIFNLIFLANWGLDTSSEEYKDLYEQYLKVSTDTTYLLFVKENLKSMEAKIQGQDAIDFKIADADGKELQFTNILGNGKVTYIDFWATWCGPCKREIPFLAKLAEEYEGKNIRVVSISIDADKKAWVKKINEDKPKWEQYIIPDLENCPGLSGYSINSIPRFMLFDSKGKLFKSTAPRPSDPETKVLIDNLIK
ncbi:MAG: TlpA family protein disulfide reductase [Bacteroidaceae bacterium]|nr:TlpA family protein disulfide reductase [Bacteroidaceae bacterium]